MSLYGLFQLCKINIDIWSFGGSSRHIPCGFWSASSIHANDAVRHIAVVGTLLTATASQHIPCLPKTRRKDRDNDSSSISGINTMSNWRHCWKPRATNSCIVLCIVRIIELLGSDQESTYMYIFWMTSSMMEWCVCDGWASCLRILQFFPALLVLLKSSSDQLRLSDEIGSKFHVYKLLSVSRGMRETSEFWCPQVFRSVTSGPFDTWVVLRTIFSFFLWQLLQRILPAWRLVHNDCLDFVCQNSFLRCGQVNSVLCILLRSSMNLMINLPQFLCLCNYFCFAGIVIETNCTLSMVEDNLYNPHGRGKVCLPSVRVCTSPVQLLSLLFFLLRVQLLQQSNDLVLSPRYRWNVLL